MIKIILNTPEKVTFEKETREEKWFKDCSNENLLKQCNREGDTIERVQWEDGNHLASLLHVYFKIEEKQEIEGLSELLQLDYNMYLNM